MSEIKYTRWYEWREAAWGTIYHSWFLVGPQGAVHVHIAQSDKFEGGGGIECHWNEYRPEFARAPDHLECQVTKRPCWHDGSSMFVSDHIMPMLNIKRITADDHGIVFGHCRDWYESKIATKEPSR
jgi:hypothetical protein